MMHCLAEAHRRAKQSLFATTPQASIMQDGADSKLFSRYACCTNQLQRKNAHLRVFNLFATHSTADFLALAHSMVSIIKEACTEWFGVPFESEEWKLPHIKLNEEAHDNLRKAVSELLADEAKDKGKTRELVSDEMYEQLIDEFPSLNLDSIKKFLPNATRHSADKPHSCKRMLSMACFVGFRN